jgi:hypothetical protein
MLDLNNSKTYLILEKNTYMKNFWHAKQEFFYLNNTGKE